MCQVVRKTSLLANRLKLVLRLIGVGMLFILPAKAQVSLPEGSQSQMVNVVHSIADRDSSIRIDSYTFSQRRQLLDLLFKNDQRYRDSLVNGSKQTVRQQFFTHRLVVNDQVNQVLLCKFIRKFGWPSRQEYGKQGSLTAWLIVWHAGFDYQRKYYPVINKAFQHKQISEWPVALEMKMKRFTH